MAVSFENELRAFVQHLAEQNPAVHEALTGGSVNLGPQEAFRTLIAFHTIQTAALYRVAAEIDTLRDSLG
jgi:hypothetical protein